MLHTCTPAEVRVDTIMKLKSVNVAIDGPLHSQCQCLLSVSNVDDSVTLQQLHIFLKLLHLRLQLLLVHHLRSGIDDNRKSKVLLVQMLPVLLQAGDQCFTLLVCQFPHCTTAIMFGNICIILLLGSLEFLLPLFQIYGSLPKILNQ